MSTLPVASLIDSFVDRPADRGLCGAPDPKSTWFIDNEPDAGILGLMKGVTAKEASMSVDGSGREGTTIAGHAEHLRWSLGNANAALRGQKYQGSWKESWHLTDADDGVWNALQDELRTEFERLCELLRQQTELSGDYLNGAMALVPHTAYHLGVIRQMTERVHDSPG